MAWFTAVRIDFNEMRGRIHMYEPHVGDEVIAYSADEELACNAVITKVTPTDKGYWIVMVKVDD